MIFFYVQLRAFSWWNVTKERLGHESKADSAHAGPVSEAASDQTKGRLPLPV